MVQCIKQISKITYGLVYFTVTRALFITIFNKQSTACTEFNSPNALNANRFVKLVHYAHLNSMYSQMESVQKRRTVPMLDVCCKTNKIYALFKGNTYTIQYILLEKKNTQQNITKQFILFFPLFFIYFSIGLRGCVCLSVRACLFCFFFILIYRIVV